MSISIPNGASRRRLLMVVLAAAAGQVAAAGQGQSIGTLRDAKEFAAEFREDEAAAVKKHGGQVVVLQGTIADVGRDLYGDSFVLIAGMKCVTTDPQPWAAFGPGQKVKIKGTVPKPQQFIAPALLNCTLSAITKDSTVETSAIDLAKEFAGDADAAAAKHDKKYFRVERKIEKITMNDAGASSIYLMGEDGYQVVCTFPGTDENEKASNGLKLGDTFTAFGQYWKLLSDENQVGLFFCLPVNKAP